MDEGQNNPQSGFLGDPASFRTIIENAPISMALVGMDGRIEYINRCAIQTFEYLLEDIPTMNRWWIQAYPDPAYRAEVIETWTGLVQKALAEETEIEGREYRVITKSGAEKVMVISGIPVANKILVIFIDVTARVMAERALQESEAFLLESQHVSGIGSYNFDIPGERWGASATLKELFGIGPDFPYTLQGWVDLLHPEDREMMIAYFQHDVLDQHGAFDKEYRIIRVTDGAERWMHGLGRVTWDDSGKPLTMTGTIQDVTFRFLADLEREQHLAAEQAARIEAETAVNVRDEFLSVAAHELNTPLAALRIVTEGLINTMNSEDSGSPKFRKGVETVERQTQRMIRLVNSLLDLTRIQTGRLDVKLGECDLMAVMKSVLRRLEPSLERAGCTVHLSGAETLAAHGDGERLEQVFENILSNAMKFGPGKPIEISGTVEDGKTCIAVRDHGDGLPPGFEDRIFGLYDRGDRKIHAGGLGIGLFICRKIMQSHGGKITARNAEGGGAILRLELPTP